MFLYCSLSTHPTLSLFYCVHKSVLYVCVSIAAPQIGSSMPSFLIPYACANIQYLSLSFWLTSLCIIDSDLIRSDSDVLCMLKHPWTPGISFIKMYSLWTGCWILFTRIFKGFLHQEYGLLFSCSVLNFPGCSDSKVSAYNVGDPDSTPGLGRYSGEGSGNPLRTLA